jgi:hypothetical protein
MKLTSHLHQMPKLKMPVANLQSSVFMAFVCITVILRVCEPVIVTQHLQAYMNLTVCLFRSVNGIFLKKYRAFHNVLRDYKHF